MRRILAYTNRSLRAAQVYLRQQRAASQQECTTEQPTRTHAGGNGVENCRFLACKLAGALLLRKKRDRLTVTSKCVRQVAHPESPGRFGMRVAWSGGRRLASDIGWTTSSSHTCGGTLSTRDLNTYCLDSRESTACSSLKSRSLGQCKLAWRSVLEKTT